jgi:hypothetical protein
VFVACVVLGIVAVTWAVSVVAVTLRQDAQDTAARDALTERWLAEQSRRYDVQAAAGERAAQAMIAARHRAPRRLVGRGGISAGGPGAPATPPPPPSPPRARPPAP